MAMQFCDISKLNFEEMIQSGLNKGSVAICEGMLKDKDRRIKQIEEIFKTSSSEKDKQIAIKETELLSERKRLALLKDFISKHTKCVGCDKKFDTLLHIPYVLTCGHTLCSLCFFNIPIITDEEEQRYAKYMEDILPPPPSSLQRNDSGGFLRKMTKSFAEAIGRDDDPVKRERFMRSYQEKVRQIEEQQKHLQGFEHIGKCPVCKTPQRGLRYDLLATFNAVKEFSFGKNGKNIKNKKNKSKSIKKSNKRKSKRKSINKRKSKRKSINKQKIKRKNNKSRSKK